MGFRAIIVGFISSKIAKKEALGEADIIVAGTMGALLGFPAFFIATRLYLLLLRWFLPFLLKIL